MAARRFLIPSLGGMDERWDPLPGTALVIENMTWQDSGSWHTSQGYRRITDEYTAGEAQVNYWDIAAPILSLFWFCQHGNALQYLIYEDQDGKLRYFDGSESPSTPYHTIRHIDQTIFASAPTRSCAGKEISHTSFGMFGMNLYILNGNDLPLVFDGKKVSRCGYSQSPAPVKANTSTKMEVRETVRGIPFGVGYANSRNQYKYAVTFVNIRGQESTLSDPSELLSFSLKIAGGWEYVIDTTGPTTSTLDIKSFTQQPVLSIPIGPAGTVARRIYRTQNMVSFLAEGNTSAGVGTTNYSESFQDVTYGSEFYFLDEVQDNVCETYVDTLSDMELGSITRKEDLGLFPSNAAFMAVYKNTMFVADENTSVLRFSRPMNPEVFPPNNTFSLSDNQTSLITGMHATRDSLIVFKSRATFAVRGDAARGFYAQTISTDTGCISPASIKDIPGIGIIFLANDGIYMLGTGSTGSGTPFGFIKISIPIPKIFARINLAHSKNFRASLYHKDREYWLSVSMDAAILPNHILKYSWENKAWSLYKDVECAGLAQAQNHNGYLYMAGRRDETGYKGILVYGGTNDKAGFGPFTSVYETSNIALGGHYGQFHVSGVNARVIGYGHVLDTQFITNREVNNSQVENAEEDRNGDALPYNVATAAFNTQYRTLEDKDFPLFGDASFDSDASYVEHRPIPLRFDISTMNKGPVAELRIRFSNDTEFELLNFELVADVQSQDKAVILTTKMGGGYGL